MQLFTKSQNKGKLQEGFGECQSVGCAVEEAPPEPKDEQETGLLGNPKKKDVFQVDLLSDWIKP